VDVVSLDLPASDLSSVHDAIVTNETMTAIVRSPLVMEAWTLHDDGPVPATHRTRSTQVG